MVAGRNPFRRTGTPGYLLTMLIETQITDSVLSVTLNDPERRNPLSAGMIQDLRSALTAVGRDLRVRCVLLTGRGAGFCAGGDLDLIDTATPAEVTRFMGDSQSIVQAVSALPMPVVIAVNGAAAGAGFSLALSGDVVLAGRAAVFVPAFARIGAVPDLGLIHTLHRSIGLHRTNDILLRGKPIDARRAEALGFVTEVVADDELTKRALEVARELASGPTVALGLTRKLIRAATTSSLETFLVSESAAQGVAFSTTDFREGIAAFRERRTPRFKGQ